MWIAILAGVATGLLGTAAYPELYVWPLAFVAYAPLVYAVRGRRPRDRFLAGWAAGAVLHVGVYTWIYDTARIMSSLPIWLSVLVLLAYSLAHGLCQGAIAFAVEPIRRHSGCASSLTVAAGATAIEVVFPHLFPWYLGNALYQALPLAQLADLTGIYGLSFLCFASACVVVEAVVRARASGPRAALRPLAGLAVALALVTGYGILRLSQVRSAPVERTLRVALLQPFMTGQEKGDLRGMARKVLYDKSADLLREVRDEGHDLIVLPEGGFPFYFEPTALDRPQRPDEPLKFTFSRMLMAEAAATETNVVFGTLLVPPDGRTRNTAVLLEPRVQPLVYEKRRLVPFGEFMPLSDTFPSLKKAVKNVSDFKAGTGHVRFMVGGVAFEPTICYEAIFPSFVRTAVNTAPRAQAILNLTNDVWFGETAAAELHLMVQVSRAIELRLPLVRGTNSGISAFVDATGAVVARTGVYERAILRSEVEIKPLWSFYREFGDVFLYGSVLVSAAWIGWRRWRLRLQPVES